MDNALKIIGLLGEKDAQKLRDGITEMLLRTTEKELEDMCDYVIDYERLFEEVEKQAFENVKAKMIARYEKKIEEKFEKIMDKQ